MDEYIFNEANLRAQLSCASGFLGIQVTRFFVKNGTEEALSDKKTDEVVEFYFYKQDNTLRNRFNRVMHTLQ